MISGGLEWRDARRSGGGNAMVLDQSGCIPCEYEEGDFKPLCQWAVEPRNLGNIPKLKHSFNPHFRFTWIKQTRISSKYFRAGLLFSWFPEAVA